jgi:dTMP kinase
LTDAEKPRSLSWRMNFLQIKTCRARLRANRAARRSAKKSGPLFLSPEHGEMIDRCELLLYMASRAQHAAETILPAMQRGAVVLCDRFADATFAYQGHGRGISLDILEKMNSYAVGSLKPSLTFVFDISVATSRARLANAGKTADRLEGSGAEFYEKVRSGYLALAGRYRDRIIVLSGDRAP